MRFKMHEEIIAKTVRELRAEAEIDFFDVSFIAEGIIEDIGLIDKDEIRQYTLNVIRHLMKEGVYPGDYSMKDLNNGVDFQFMSGTPEDIISWIENQWIAMGRAPTLDDPIWFALKRAPRL